MSLTLHLPLDFLLKTWELFLIKMTKISIRTFLKWKKDTVVKESKQKKMQCYMNPNTLAEYCLSLKRDTPVGAYIRGKRRQSECLMTNFL
jgi:hypothetical protein